MAEMAVKCKVFYDNVKRRIFAELPLTLQTSLVRIKDVYGHPIGSVRRQELKENWYIEWQISYFDEKKHLVELGKMFELAVTKLGIISRQEVIELYKYLENRAKRKKYVEQLSTRLVEGEISKEFEGFKLIYRITPVLRKSLSDGSFIHIELKHKQKAIGYQAMLYIYIPLKNTVSKVDNKPPVGRSAYVKEYVLWSPTKEHIIELLKGFSLMSQKHLRDILEILRRFVN